MSRPKLRHGSIVWVELLDPQGRNPKIRPAVVITPTDDITDEGSVHVIGITSQTNESASDVTVDLPWHRNQHPRTKLRRASVAVCTWQQIVSASEIVEIRGQVPVPEMMQILTILNSMNQPPTDGT